MEAQAWTLINRGWVICDCMINQRKSQFKLEGKALPTPLKLDANYYYQISYLALLATSVGVKKFNLNLVSISFMILWLYGSIITMFFKTTNAEEILSGTVVRFDP